MKKPRPKIKKKVARKAPPKRNSKDSFFEVVFDIVRLIPRGRATSYGAIAEYSGLKLSARMVGWAMNAAHVASPSIPAHRVVNRNGMLSGRHHFATPTLMEELLKSEGIKIKDNTIVDFDKIFWDPARELL
ncbi:MAG: cysteine methyltransferase [Bacteroidetes bacterium]|nr:MAG: cysteine methyltransferase [Bacteroidota bacterium]